MVTQTIVGYAISYGAAGVSVLLMLLLYGWWAAGFTGALAGWVLVDRWLIGRRA